MQLYTRYTRCCAYRREGGGAGQGRQRTETRAHSHLPSPPAILIAIPDPHCYPMESSAPSLEVLCVRRGGAGQGRRELRPEPTAISHLHPRFVLPSLTPIIIRRGGFPKGGGGVRPPEPPTPRAAELFSKTLPSPADGASHNPGTAAHATEPPRHTHTHTHTQASLHKAQHNTKTAKWEFRFQSTLPDSLPAISREITRRSGVIQVKGLQSDSRGRSRGRLQLVRCGPATQLQPRLPHGLHCQLSSMIVRVTQTVFCSSFLPSSLDGVRVGLHLLGSGHCRLWTESGA